MSQRTAVAAFACWLALAWLPLLAQPSAPGRIPSAPIPADPHEPVTGGVQVAASPADRAAALSLLVRAQQNSKLHSIAVIPPHRIDVAFNATGNVKQTGTGEFSEIWLSGRQWRWTASLGGVSIVRLASGGPILQGEPASEVPMRVHMLRNAIFWAAQPPPSNAQIRTADVQWNGKPVTCLLFSRVAPAAQIQTRMWEESEDCIDPASGLLQVDSIAPGTYTVYGYAGSVPFHGRLLPDRITIYVGGAVAVDASFRIADLTPSDESSLSPAPEMVENGDVVELEMPVRFPIVASGANAAVIQPVIVHAQINGDGTALEEEISAASDPALAQRALDLVKGMRFHYGGVQRQAYTNVRFSPAPQ